MRMRRSNYRIEFRHGNNGQKKLASDTLEKLGHSLSKLGLIGDAVIEEFDKKFTHAARDHSNVIPGLHMSYSINQKTVLDWERANTLESKAKKRLHMEVFSM